MLGNACGARRTLTTAPNLEVDPALAGVQFNVDHFPRRLKVQGRSEERFDLTTHRATPKEVWSRPIQPQITVFVDLSISTGNGIELVGLDVLPKVLHRIWTQFN